MAKNIKNRTANLSTDPLNRKCVLMIKKSKSSSNINVDTLCRINNNDNGESYDKMIHLLHIIWSKKEDILLH